MGTDIHMMVEVQKDNGEWVAIKAIPKKANCFVSAWKEAYEKPEHERDYLDRFNAENYQVLLEDGGMYQWVEPPRNYRLFAILGNVRNFAGTLHGDLGENEYSPVFNYITDNRGVPEDASPEYLRLVKDWGEDGHSHSFVTVQEILDFDFDQVAKMKGFVDEENYRKFVEEGKPERWCGYVGGGSIEIVSNDEMYDLVFNKHVPYDERYYTQVEWNVTYRDCCKFLLDNIIPEVMEVTKDMVNGDWNKVRFVFFFDS